MPRKAKTKSALSNMIEELILDARKNERRERLPKERYNFFRPVSIRTADDRCYSAFSREISPVGIGLLHDVALTPGQIECRISSPLGCPISVPLEIIWCQPCGEGWYISGGEFVGVDD